MRDNLYEDFCDPSKDFFREPRAFCYEMASDLISRAKEADNWHDDIRVVKSILLLLYTWNFASRETKKLNFENIGQLINGTKEDLRALEKYSIINADNNAWAIVESIFDKFRKLFGQTGASKALSLLNPELFVMWDTSIRRRLNKELIPGIMNGERSEYYVKFLMGMQKIIKDYGIIEKLPHGSIVAKKIDEYHYVKIVMKKNPKETKKKNDGKNNYITLEPDAKRTLPDNLGGRSIYDKVIPMVCNLRNTLRKLRDNGGDVSKLKQWELRSYSAYRIDEIQAELLNQPDIGPEEKEIIRNHILQGKPSDFGASCIDVYLVAYASEHYGVGKARFFQFIKEKGISEKDNVAQAIWQVGKGDGVFLDVLNEDGTIKDKDFFVKWAKGH